jgi:hypothetical protein
MDNYSEFKFKWAYHVAGYTREKFLTNDPQEYLDDFFDIKDSTFQNCIISPKKYTILHQVIEIDFSNDIDDMNRKIEIESALANCEELLDDYNIPYNYKDETEINEDNEQDYLDELTKVVQEEVVPKVAEEVFTLLFSDRMFLLKFNEIVAKSIRELKVKDYSDLLARDGVIKRCSYFPKWAQNAIFLRERGRCAICLRDLTGLLNTDFKSEIDHIVPLNLGGINDITNLQLLCTKCNNGKSGHTIRTSEYYPKYF